MGVVAVKNTRGSTAGKIGTHLRIRRKISDEYAGAFLFGYYVGADDSVSIYPQYRGFCRGGCPHPPGKTDCKFVNFRRIRDVEWFEVDPQEQSRIRSAPCAADGCAHRRNNSMAQRVQKSQRTTYAGFLCWHYLFSRPVTRQVSSAELSLTSVFGMGTGGPSIQSTPTIQFDVP